MTTAARSSAARAGLAQVGSGFARVGTSLPILTGIFILPVPGGTVIHPTAAGRTNFCSSHNRPAPETVTQPALTCDRLEPLFTQGISQTLVHTYAVSSPEFLGTRSPAILPALAAPRSSAACRRPADGSEALLPAGASSTWHASPAGLRFSPARCWRLVSDQRLTRGGRTNLRQRLPRL